MPEEKKLPVDINISFQQQPSAKPKEVVDDMIRFPSGNVPTLIHETLAANTGDTFTTEEGFINWREKMEAPSHGKTTYHLRIAAKKDGVQAVTDDGQLLIPGVKRTIVRNTAREVTAVTISDITKLAASNITARNVVDSILYEAGRFYISPERSLQKDSFTIPYDNLVGYGVASNKSNVKRLVNSVTDVLGGIRVFRQTKTEGNQIPDVMTMTLFPTLETNKEGLYVRLNSDLDWTGIIQGFLIAPEYLWQIKTRLTKSLLLYICDLIRINKRDFFTVSIRAIIARLGLPSEQETTHPKRDIKEAIENAVAEINKEERKHTGDNKQLLLQLKVKNAAKIKDWIDSGELVVRISGRMINSAEAIQKKQDKIIKRHEQRIERAKLAALTKKATEDIQAQLDELEAFKEGSKQPQ